MNWLGGRLRAYHRRGRSRQGRAGGKCERLVLRTASQTFRRWRELGAIANPKVTPAFTGPDHLCLSETLHGWLRQANRVMVRVDSQFIHVAVVRAGGTHLLFGGRWDRGAGYR